MTIRRTPPLTLGRVFFLTLAGLGLLGAIVFAMLLRGWRHSLVESSEKLRDAAAGKVEALVNAYLEETEKALADVEQAIRSGVTSANDLNSLEAALFAQVVSNPRLAEVTFTRAERLGFDEVLQARLAPSPRRQLSVFREVGDEGDSILTRHTRLEGHNFVSDVTVRPRGGESLRGAEHSRRKMAADDPIDHPTFGTTASAPFQDRLLWSDLHFAELDSHLPEGQRRVVVTVMKAVTDGEGRFLGVLRVGSSAEQIEGDIRSVRVDEAVSDDPHRVFLCDEEGRLLVRLSAKDRVADVEGNLRVVPEGLPEEIAVALRHPALQQVRSGQTHQSGRFESKGQAYLVTFLGLGQTQGWRVGIVVPENHYLRNLERARGRLVAGSVAVLVVALLLAGLSLRTVRRGLRQVVASTRRMQSFEFDAMPVRSPFRDVVTVMDGLELAKTAMRAMSRYVPVDLVRHLYETKREPILGGELMDVSLMFTDIEGFTSFAEELSPDELAQALGLYLQAMTEVVHRENGAIDKFIGDAIMALWNAPRSCLDHARKACRAALACLDASRALHASPEWKGRPLFRTRFGLHRDRVLVGHFGAPDRMSYTALGDGVNLASRLEGLNKRYGTAIIVSETIREAAGDAFAFRLLDRVAVKGKTKSIQVYELMGDASIDEVRIAIARRYEEALSAHFDRRFDDALALLETQIEDGPSRVLADRCRVLREHPPPADWDGAYVATTK